MKRDYRLFIEDILESIERIEEFVGNMDFEEFSRDDKTRSAVVRKLEIIGEASKNIPRRLKEKYGARPWSDMARMRDKIIHWYFGINYRIVWEVIKERLPQIKPVIQKMLKEMEG